MLLSFFVLSVRNLFRKNRLFTITNILGLAVGLASLFLVSLFIFDEFNFDTYHRNAHRVYRVVLDYSSDGDITQWAKTSAPVGQYLRGAFPEIEQVVRIRKNPGTDLITNNDLKFYEERIFFADSTLFDVLDIKLEKGNQELALKDKNSIVLSEQMAKKYFNHEEALGKMLRYNNQIDLKVTGIIQSMPSNSHFVADAFVTFSSLDDILGEKRLMHWGQFDHYTYILLTNNSSPLELESKFPMFLKENAPEWVPEKIKLFLQPLTSIHLHSDRKDEITVNSNESYSYILGTIALFIIVMACANFINLSTATQVSRFKGIAIQKMLGASSRNLIIYFWIESIIICVVALLSAFLLAWMALPYFNVVTGKQMSLLNSLWLSWPLLIVTLIVGSVAAIFPAWQSHHVPISLAIKMQGVEARKSGIRTTLVTFQFFISVFLLIATWIVSNQFTFLKSSRMGFNSEDIIVVPVKDRSQNDKYATLVNEIVQLQGVEKASFSSSTPGANNSLTYSYTMVGSELHDVPLSTFIVDENFFDLYEIGLKEGRLLNLQNADTLVDVVLNESAVQHLRLSNPIGQLVTGKVKGKVIGIVENFNHTTLRSGIEPVIMYSFTPTFRMISIKFKHGERQIALRELEKKWPELFPGFPLEYSFLDDQIQQLYGAEFQLSHAYSAFSIIAITIAGVGLIGLTGYLLRRKLKEISIRKVFGSSANQVILWIYSGYLKIVLVSTVLACVAGYYFMRSWLDNFVYKIDLNATYFLLPALLMILTLLITTGLQTIKAARTKPVESLREE